MKKFKNFLEKLIFWSRWLLIPFYLGLFIVLVLYTYVYIHEIAELIHHVGILDKNVIMLSALEMVDIVMIANLIKMIITGSYNSFVSKSHGFDGEKASSGMLKVKMSTSLAGVSSIHMLQVFINASNTEWDIIYKQLAIHGIFLVGALILAWIEYLHCKGDALHPEEKQH